MTDNTAPEPNGQHDAHVQVLTAEVRTLMVGSRQVTMSVYNQLDEIEPLMIDPFGRVSPGKSEFWKVYVVGRDSATGALARAWLFSERGLAALVDRNSIRVSGGTVVIPRIWRDADKQERIRLAKQSAEWRTLPKIVLAGLR